MATSRLTPAVGDTSVTAATTDALNSLLRGELSAVETYAQCIAKFGSAAPRELRDCQLSHEERAQLLTRRIADLGGEPAASSGVWGGFAKMMEGGAKMFGRQAALAMLEEGEDHGLRQYEQALDDVDMESRRLIEEELLPEQQSTHQVLRNLKHQNV